MGSHPICHPSPARKMECSFVDYIQLLMIGWAGWWTQTPSATPLQPEKWNAHFWITFNFWSWPGWSMPSNPVCHPSPASKMESSFLDYVQLLMIGPCWSMDSNSMQHTTPAKIIKCSFLHYVQLLMIGWAGIWTWMPSVTPLQPKNIEMLIFGLCSTSDN